MARKGSEPPEVKYLEALRAELETTFQSEDEELRLTREMRELKTKPALDPDLQFLSHDPLPDAHFANEGFKATATLALHDPTVTVTPADPDSEDQQKLATRREQWIRQMLKVCGDTPGMMHTFAAVVDAAANDGGGWSKVVNDRNSWDRVYAVRRGEFTPDEGWDIDPEKTRPRRSTTPPPRPPSRPPARR